MSRHPNRPIGYSPGEISSRINETVVSQHAEEAAFLWTMRKEAIHAPHYRLKDLVKLDERVEAHLNGLRVSGHFGWELCESALGQGPGEIFAAGVLAYGEAVPARQEKVLTLAAGSMPLQKALCSALAWLPFEKIQDSLTDLMRSGDPVRVKIGLTGYALHRHSPSDLKRCVLHNQPTLRTRALRAAAELGQTELLPDILMALHDTDKQCRLSAAWAAARLGDRGDRVMAALEEFLETPNAVTDNAAGIALRCMPVSAATAWCRHRLADPIHRRSGIYGAGITGDPSLIGDLLAFMEVPDLARAAGQAFSMITGADLAFESLDRNRPESFESGPSEDPRDENIGLDSEEDLPWPSPDRVIRWWESHRSEFQKGRRYLRGKELLLKFLFDTLESGYQPQRRAAALESALLDPRSVLFEIRARGSRQREMICQ